ncbi:MAG TPA: cytochrome c [Polyangiaceae bacterium]|nr:cytochrome c [Polyangiaceae bacterium]
MNSALAPGVTRGTLLLGLSLLGSLACGSGRRSEPLVGALALNTEQRRGEVLFHKFCHQCHPNGEPGLGPGFNTNPAPLAAVRLQVRTGLGAMPAFPEALISDPDLDQLLAFVDAQRDQSE